MHAHSRAYFSSILANASEHQGIEASERGNPLIDQAKREWQTVGPAAQILIDVVSYHVNRGSSPAEAAETVRAALNGSINSAVEDHVTDREMSCAAVLGGTGFVGRRAVRNLRKTGTRVRIVSRHRGLGEDDGIVCRSKRRTQNARQATRP
jgi:hypothetical protein